MVFCPKCGADAGNAKFCPECGSPQGAKGTRQPIHRDKTKENYSPLLGACLCCCLSPIVTFLYYYFTEPDEDSFMRTFIFIAIMCAVGIGLSFGFLILVMVLTGGEFFEDIFSW